MIHRRQAGRPARPHRRGQVLIILLVCLAVLVGLVFHVYNAGRQINRRMDLQNAADSAAVAGATHTARSMNVVAMNNVTQARLLALICVMDALPLAAEMTVAEETGDHKLPDALRRWRNERPAFTRQEKDNFFNRGLTEIHRQMNPGNGDTTQLDLLEELDARLDHPDEKSLEGSYDVRETTQWPNGSAWLAAEALDHFSQALADSSGVLAQHNAKEFAEGNRAEKALLLPVVPDIPARRGSFDDFAPVMLDHIRYGQENRNDPSGPMTYEVVRSNLVENLAAASDVPWRAREVSVRGGAIPEFEFPHRMGPFAVRDIYGWRDYWHQWAGDYENDLVNTWGYTTFGPLEHALRTVLWEFGQAGHWWHSGTLDLTRFAYHLRTLARVKLAYLFGLPSGQRIQYADVWLTDYNEARQFVEDNEDVSPSPVMVTRWYRVHVKSTVPPDELDRWMTTYDPTPPTLDFVPDRYWSWQLKTPSPPSVGDTSAQPLRRWIRDHKGWRDPAGGEKLGGALDYLWRRSGQRQVNFGRELGLPERYEEDENGDIKLDANGEPIPVPYTVYWMEWRLFGGVEVREEVTLSNPAHGAHSLPAPMLISEAGKTAGQWQNLIDPNDQALTTYRPEAFLLMAAAGRNDRAEVWPSKFRSPNPNHEVTALAAAKVFNPSSWELWTQNWHAELTPILGHGHANWQTWLDTLQRGIGDAAASDGLVDPADVEELLIYLGGIEDDSAREFLLH